jgi:hypothetical protein
MYSPLSGWEKITKAMEESGVMFVTDRKVMASYNSNHAHWFTDGKPVVTGKVIGGWVLVVWMDAGWKLRRPSRQLETVCGRGLLASLWEVSWCNWLRACLSKHTQSWSYGQQTPG